ncbi:MAG TPA: hypothetical protein VJR58_20615 [Vineibacter sp.]|nr:hypothetical protein [Vineibacter sp.]
MDAGEIEQAIDPLVRKHLLIAAGTPAHSVRLTSEGWKMATSVAKGGAVIR